jgi:hypothetical protein
MQILSALDAISPAFSRTKLVLFSPFRKGRTWKLAVTSYLGFAGTMFFPFTLIYLAFVPQVFHSAGRVVAVAVVFCILLATAVFLVVYYLCARLLFVSFDIVLNRGEFVAPAWRKYGRQGRQWAIFMAGIGTVATLAAATPLIVYARHMFILIKSMQSLSQGQSPPPEFFAGLFAGYLFVLLFFSGLMVVCTTMAALMVPSLSLEQVSLWEALRRLGKLIQHEPGQFLGFVAARIVLGIAGYMAVTICFEVALLVQILAVGIVALLLGMLLHLAGVPTLVLIILAIAVSIALYLFNVVYGMLMAFGIFCTFMQAHTLYFLGGRYPMLGDLLDRSTPPPAAPPMYPPPGYFMPPPPPAGAAGA